MKLFDSLTVRIGSTPVVLADQSYQLYCHELGLIRGLIDW